MDQRPGAALVAGATGGIGAAVVRMLAARGTALALTYRSNHAAAEALVASLATAPPGWDAETEAHDRPRRPDTEAPDRPRRADTEAHDRPRRPDTEAPDGPRRAGREAHDGPGDTDATTAAPDRGDNAGGRDAPRARVWRLDLTDADGCATVLAEAAETFGGIHTVVYAAGPHVPMLHLSRVTPAQFREQLDQDAVGFFTLAHAALPYLRRTRGNLVAVTTAATRRFPVRDGLSAGPKAAVEALVRGIAAEEGRYGVRANCVGPGLLTDGMAARLMASGDLSERALDVARTNIPLGHFGTAEDVAEAVCFLASDAARFITGQKLDVDGGYSA